jgi:3D (Asp-Asp-Asp) domain-containing protein
VLKTRSMKKFYAIGFLFLFVASASAREETVLARVTGYWAQGEGGSGGFAASNGARLRAGHCAVDPKRIPYGSKVVFPDATCVAVDTGPSVVSRKSARSCGQTSAQKNAIVVDRFFESKRDAVEWSNAHSQFMTLRIISAGSHSEPPPSFPVVTATIPKIASPSFLGPANNEQARRIDDPILNWVFGRGQL